MKTVAAMIISLVLVFGLAAQDALAQRSGKEAREEVRSGGWAVAFGNKIPVSAASRGYVERGLSIFNSDRKEIRDWADRILDRAINEMDSRFGGGANFLRDDDASKRDVRKFFVRNVRDMFESRRDGSNSMTIGRLEVKAGVMEYYSRRDDKKVIVPYIGLREMERRGGGGWPDDSWR